MVLAWLLRRRRLPMDHPNVRSLHVTPTPRIGGLGIMAGVGVASLWLADAVLLPAMLQHLPWLRCRCWTMCGAYRWWCACWCILLRPWHACWRWA